MNTGRRIRLALLLALLLWAVGADASRSALILVDRDNGITLAAKLDRWVADLKLLGWQARWVPVPPDARWPDMAGLLQAQDVTQHYDHLALVGRVPWYYCTPLSPDGHPERPWVCDAFYASRGVGWTASPSDPAVLWENVFTTANAPVVAVGRIDARDLPAYAAVGWDEAALLSAYLDKAHAWRSGAWTLPRRSLVSDHCSTIVGPGQWAAQALLNASVLTPADIVQRDLTFIEEYTRDGGLGGFLLQQFFCLSSANYGPDAAGWFAENIGTWECGIATVYVSYTGDWFRSNSWLRGAAMHPLTCLGAVWGIGLDLRSMATTGSTVGECFLVESRRTGYVAEAWMGDPTIELRQGLTHNPPPTLGPPREPPKRGHGKGNRHLRAPSQERG